MGSLWDTYQSCHTNVLSVAQFYGHFDGILTSPATATAPSVVRDVNDVNVDSTLAMISLSLKPWDDVEELDPCCPSCQ